MIAARALDPDAWFHNGVVEGLQFLWTLGLPGTPAGELATLVATSWVQAMWDTAAWAEEADAGRLHQAFLRTGGSADRWPTPRQVLDAMPARPRPLALPQPRTPVPGHVKELLTRLRGAPQVRTE